MDYRRYFQSVLEQRYPSGAPQLLRDMESRYQSIYPEVAFACRSANPMDRRLDLAAYFLATALTLEGHGADFNEIESTCLEIAQEYVRPRSSVHALFKRLPARLIPTPFGRWIVEILKRKTGKLGHPDGFRTEILTDPAATFGLGYGVDILECGICKLYQRHGAQRFAAILCEVDKLTADLAGLKMYRTGTIATGAKKCDFRWSRL